MPRLLLCPLLLALSVIGAHAQTLSPADIKALLARVREKRVTAPNLQAEFQEQRKVHLLDEPIVSNGKVWSQAPDKFRREVKGNSPSVMISDGQQFWIYYPNFSSAEHYSLARRSPLNAALAAINTALNLENVENTFHISGTKIEGGYELELLPKTPSMRRIFQRLDIRINNELSVMRTDMLQPNGDRIVTSYTNQQSSPIPPATFEFTPPPGTEVTTPMGK
jgi:outer membrane lipoprotein carrier protein